MSRLTPEQARRILATVPFQDRLIGTRLIMPTGIKKEDMRSMQEVSWFLEPTMRSLPGLRLERLATWIENHFADKETAAAVREIEKNNSSLAAAYWQTWELIEGRVREAEEVLYG